MDTHPLPDFKIKHKTQNNLFAIILLNGKDATIFWKLVVSFEALS